MQATPSIQSDTLHIRISRNTAPDVDIRLPATVWPRLQDVMPEACRTVIISEYGDFDHFRASAGAVNPTRKSPFSFHQGNNTITLWFAENQ